MGYAFAVILVVLIVAAAVTVAVMRATRTRQQHSASDHDDGGKPSDIVAPDSETPLGDTAQHAGEHTREGTTVGGQDADRGVRERSADDHVPPVGGEQPAGEGEGSRPL